MITNEQPPSPSTRGPGRRRWTPLFAVAAVLAGLGAGTVAGAHAGSLITGRQIRDNSLLSKDVHNGTLTGRDVRDASLRARDFSGDTTGPAGNHGPAGPAGQAGMHDVTIQTSGLVDIDPKQQVLIQVDCPQGFVVSGGLTSGDPYILESSPDGDRTWDTWAYNPNEFTSLSVRAHAVCASFNVGP